MKKNKMDAAVKSRRIIRNADDVLDAVLERLSKEFRLPKVQTQDWVELQGGTYVVSREPPGHPFSRGLSYADKTANFYFSESDPFRLDYFVSPMYIEVQFGLLERTGTDIGRQLVRRLSEIKRERSSSDSKINRPSPAVGLCAKLEIPNFNEVYKFIKGHITYR